MQNQDDISNRSARNAEITNRYARLWKSIVSGVVTRPNEDVASWYAAAQHGIGAALHESAMDSITSPETVGEAVEVKSAA